MDELSAFQRLDATRRVADALRRSQAHRASGGLWGASSALLLTALQRDLQRPFLVVTCGDDDCETLRSDLETFGARDVAHLPCRNLDIDGLPEPNAEGARARCLSGIGGESAPGAWLVLASLEALTQPAPDIRALRAGQRVLRVGERLDQGELFEACLQSGLRKVPVVIAPGEVSRRGDVLDVHPLAATEAIRLEFFDDELESIRTFDPESQRSREVRQEVLLHLGSRAESGSDGKPTHPLAHLIRPDLVVVWFEPLRIDERRRALVDHGGSDGKNRIVEIQETLGPRPWLEVSSLPSQDLDFKILSAGSSVGEGEADPLGRLRAIRGLKGDAVEIVCRTDSERERLTQIFEHKGVDLAAERVRLRTGALSRGFRVPELGWTVLSNVEFAGVPAPARVTRPKVQSRAVQSFFELGPGDLVVHAAHGIALFEGIERVQRGDAEEDHLRLIFKDDVRLLVPVSKIHLVQKYIGAGSAVRPKLDKLGGRGFQKRKEEVAQAMFDLAADLLEVQAAREKQQRPAYPEDPLEQDFLDDFPFEDTPDQATCWAEIKADLEGERPMDRLVCGDVGFGKTELALRAAFKVAITGRQVAVLVPTTVLAEQHGRTFGRRFEPHGLRVETLSRFGTAKQRKQTVADTLLGKVDVLIGTHRILGKDVEFADLGMVVVDEEQRFGVRQKEHLKKLRALVDVLSLSATPIPRTLHASLLGIRQISALTTPPIGRQDVETKVVFRSDELLQDAIRHELARDGQVFVLHDRISGLPALVERIQSLHPEAKIAMGHGKLTETELEKQLRRFVRGEADVLVCTSIVENGLDLPRANTILIDRAEMFGLAELHQLRGRVGRSSVKAHCYLMMDRLQPPPEASRRRLKALEEFSNLGAGFQIAMKDLEIRGAGNLLGPQQSGHIAAVGYEMYCQLLRTAVEDARHEHAALRPPETREVDVNLQVTAYLPDSFEPDAKARLEIVRGMDDATTPERAVAIRQELTDRFGKLPPPVENLLRIFLVKHLLMAHGVRSIQRTEADRLVVRHPPEEPLGGAWLDRFADVRPVEAGKTHLILPPPRGRSSGERSSEDTLQLLLEALCGDPGLPKIGSREGRGRGGRRKRPTPARGVRT